MEATIPRLFMYGVTAGSSFWLAVAGISFLAAFGCSYSAFYLGFTPRELRYPRAILALVMAISVCIAAGFSLGKTCPFLDRYLFKHYRVVLPF